MAREMKDSGIKWIGEIPEEWGISPLGTCFIERKEKVSDVDYPPLSVTKTGIHPQLENVAKTKNNDDRKKVCIGDFAINSRSDRKQSCGLSDIEGSVSVINTILEPRNIESDYVRYLLDNYGFAEEFYRWGYGIHADLWSTRFTTMKKIMLPIPSRNEQKRIAKYLFEKVTLINSIIDKTKQSIEEYKKYKQSLITEVVTKGLNPNVKMKDSGIEWIGEIPEGWEVYPLRYIGSLQNGISIGGDSFGSGYPFVSYSDVYKNYQLPSVVEGLLESDEKAQLNYSVFEGDVFFTRTSETIEEIGYASTCFESIENAVFAGFLIRFRQYGKKLNNFYSKYYFRSEMHRKFFVKEMNLVTRASLSQELLKRMPVLVPPYEEQEEIGEYLEQKCSEIDNHIKNKEKMISELESYKKSLIYEVVTGKKEVS